VLLDQHSLALLLSAGAHTIAPNLEVVRVRVRVRVRVS